MRSIRAEHLAGFAGNKQMESRKARGDRDVDVVLEVFQEVSRPYSGSMRVRETSGIGWVWANARGCPGVITCCLYYSAHCEPIQSAKHGRKYGKWKCH